MDAERPQERHRDLDRFLTFVDAVTAIAITLLVLPLAELGSELRDGTTVAHLLHEHLGEIGAFLLSFVVIANLWFAQHRVLRPVVLLSPIVGRLLLVWTLAIVALPFCTELVANAGSDPLTKLLYLGAMVLSEICLGLIAEISHRHPETTDGSAVQGPLVTWAAVVTLAVALALSLAFPVLSYYPLLLLLLDNRLAIAAHALFSGSHRH